MRPASPSNDLDTGKRPPISDSGWFWACMFSVMALVGIAAISGKFDFRQRQLEGRLIGRQTAAQERERRAAGLAPIDLADEARDREQAQPGRIVPLWTLVTAAVAGAAGSFVMLVRERRGRNTEGAVSR